MKPIEELENTTEKSFRDSFYFLCQYENILTIEACFKNPKISTKITPEIISYGLLGSARTNKIENAKALLSFAQKYKNINIEEIYCTPAINLGLQKKYFDFVNQLIVSSKYLENPMDINKPVIVINDTQNIGNNYSIVESKYSKFAQSPFKMYSQNLENLEILLNHKVNMDYIKNVIVYSIAKNNMIPLLAIVKSQYLEKLSQDNNFNIYMNNSECREVKDEFQNLINNALLEKKLNTQLPLKNTKIHQKKI